jgi:hypothetical protein
MSQLIRLTDEAKFAPAGLPFETTNQARWCHRQSHQNGYADAFVRIGKIVAIDVPKFHEIARMQASVRAAGAA